MSERLNAREEANRDKGDPLRCIPMFKQGGQQFLLSQDIPEDLEMSVSCGLSGGGESAKAYNRRQRWLQGPKGGQDGWKQNGA